MRTHSYVVAALSKRDEELDTLLKFVCDADFARADSLFAVIGVGKY